MTISLKLRNTKKNSNHKFNTNQIDPAANHEMRANYFFNPYRYVGLENMNKLCENSDDLTDIESNTETFIQDNNDNNKERNVIKILSDSMV